MGCDGGTIPTRDELVKTRKKPEQKDKNSELAFRWKHCAISQERLVEPIVACELGRLYNKESVLKVFIDKTELSPMFRHLRGMRDVKELILTANPAKSSHKVGTGDGYVDSGISDYICPVVGLEMSGKYKFSLLWSCGCVLSDRALKEVKSKVCHKCGKPFSDLNVIQLNRNEEDEEKELEERMITRRALAKATKKSKKSEKSTAVSIGATNGTESPASTSSSSSPGETSTKLSADQSQASGTTVKRSDSDSTKLPSSSKDSKLKVKSSSSSGTTATGTKRKAGIQDDPTTSKVFKSLFTSSEKAKNQQQAHWVTYNPLYF